MATIKVSTATNDQIDWMVATCEGDLAQYGETERAEKFHRMWHQGVYLHYSTDWAQGGPIIEREKISTYPMHRVVVGTWRAENYGRYLQAGPTPLMAAMRCYVASKLGDEVEVPDELV